MCSPIEESLDNPQDLSNLYQVIASHYGFLVQYNQDTAGVFPNVTIDRVCSVLTETTLETPLERLAASGELILAELGEPCYDYKYDPMMESWRNITWSDDGASLWRQWFYQICTELGFFRTSSSEPHTFGNKFPLDFYIQQCKDVFGEKFSTDFIQGAVNWTNIVYGGLDIDVTNVVFVHGSIDPWHALGVTTTVRPLAPAILIEGEK